MFSAPEAGLEVKKPERRPLGDQRKADGVEIRSGDVEMIAANVRVAPLRTMQSTR
jgi:hypothetical protein